MGKHPNITPKICPFNMQNMASSQTAPIVYSLQIRRHNVDYF